MDETLKRLLILYTFSEAGIKISKDQLAMILLNSTSLTWFELQLTLNKLIEDNLVTSDKNNKMALTLNGDQVVKIYSETIPEELSLKIKNYIKDHSERLGTDLITYSHFTNHDGGFKTELKITENNITLLEINLFIPTREQAERICESFQKNPNDIYKAIIEILS